MNFPPVWPRLWTPESHAADRESGTTGARRPKARAGHKDGPSPLGRREPIRPHALSMSAAFWEGEFSNPAPGAG